MACWRHQEEGAVARSACDHNSDACGVVSEKGVHWLYPRLGAALFSMTASLLAEKRLRALGSHPDNPRAVAFLYFFRSYKVKLKNNDSDNVCYRNVKYLNFKALKSETVYECKEAVPIHKRTGRISDFIEFYVLIYCFFFCGDTA